MAQRPRIHYTDTQKALMWDRWQRGESLHEIARLFDRHHSAVRRILAETGGIRPMPRRRAARTLTLAEREEISRALVTGRSIRAIALQLHRAPSTISREIRGGGGRDGYRANQADQQAWDRAPRSKICKLAKHRMLATRVAKKLRGRWAPEQIAGWLKRAYPGTVNNDSMGCRQVGRQGPRPSSTRALCV
jgi:IS30 family transposase